MSNLDSNFYQFTQKNILLIKLRLSTIQHKNLLNTTLKYASFLLLFRISSDLSEKAALDHLLSSKRYDRRLLPPSLGKWKSNILSNILQQLFLFFTHKYNISMKNTWCNYIVHVCLKNCQYSVYSKQTVLLFLICTLTIML